MQRILGFCEVTHATDSGILREVQKILSHHGRQRQLGFLSGAEPCVCVCVRVRVCVCAGRMH